MCFHSEVNEEKKVIEERFNAVNQTTLFDIPLGVINGFTFPKTPVITNDKVDVIQALNWGLIPFWAKDNSIRKYTLNAKIETLHEKPSYRDAVKNRCLIISNGFFEWQWIDPKGKKKQKYHITMPDKELFAFAGIWSEWVDKVTGEIVKSYSMVTTEANELMSEIHNIKKRMPVILTPENEKEWLAGDSIELFSKPQIDLIATPF